jgi:hypothetical protein
MSRRFKSRNHRAVAQPDAEPSEPVVLDDSNSYLDTFENVRKPLTLNARRYAVAESTEAAEADDGAGG